MKKRRGIATKILASKGTYILLALALCVAGASAYVQKTREQIAEINRESEVYEYPVAAIEKDESTAIAESTPEPTIPATEVPVATTAPLVAEAMSENVVETPIPTAPPEEEIYEFMMPAQGEIVLGYSGDELVYSKTLKDWRTHKAIDVAMDKGGFVCAMGNGTVVQSCADEMMGYTVIIDHGNNIVSIYCGLDGETALKAGDTVRIGDLIAQLGEPGVSESEQKYHLHFAVKKNGKYIDPQDLFTE
jgi:murein DD-endopeptidase MepM/ murein hydrolase activator NlpD